MHTKNSLFLKKGIIITLVLFAMLVFPLSSLAAISSPENEVEPFWVNIEHITLDITFSQNNGVAVASVGRVFGITTSIEATLTVYVQDGNDWVFVDSTTKSSTRSLAISLEFDAEEGATYKAVLDVIAYGTSVDETETIEKIETN